MLGRAAMAWPIPWRTKDATRAVSIAYGCSTSPLVWSLPSASPAWESLLHLPVISRWFIRKRGTAIGIAMVGRPMGPCTGEQVSLEPRVAVVRCRDLRRFGAYLEDDFFANLHRPRLRATWLGNVSRTGA